MITHTHSSKFPFCGTKRAHSSYKWCVRTCVRCIFSGGKGKNFCYAFFAPTSAQRRIVICANRSITHTSYELSTAVMYLRAPKKGLTFSIWVHVQNTKAARIGQIISILCSVLLTFFLFFLSTFWWN